ncbi:MAG TPA: phospholipase D family protein [Gammaproteobacteria bacterium]|nr:phospholipase D family protein [Gammaproteobacteria bacterium]
MPKAESHVILDTQDTYLGRTVADDLRGKPEGHSGFVTFPNGIDALAARLLMAERAEKTIDAQYYLLKSDTVGSAFISVLLKAADRGVRVRLLLDDIFTSGYDAGIAGLSSHPNFEVRIFNPFANRSARFLDGITSFRRINRRMHNKSFTVDNQVTLIGGRNIADEYFGARSDAKFSDLDVLAIGPVVEEVSHMFDDYWNHERSAPAAAFAKMPDDPAAELARLRTTLDDMRKTVLKTRYAEAVTDVILDYIESDEDELVWAPYTLTVDSPDKSIKSKSAEAASITTPLFASIANAEKEVIVISPYFVPRKAGIEAFSNISAKGVEVTIITNSLSANNQFSVHGGYAPARKPLLKNGIRIYEARADATIAGSEFATDDDAKATLHTKAFVVDGAQIFIGSFNFDPRSAKINTELGVIIHSSQMAQKLVEFLAVAIPDQTYEVFLDERENVRWRTLEKGEIVVFDKEPNTTWGQRFVATIMRMLPIRGQL